MQRWPCLHVGGRTPRPAASDKHPELLQVVVDDDATAKALLQHGQLRRRTTIIPLNKVGAPNRGPALAVAYTATLGT